MHASAGIDHVMRRLGAAVRADDGGRAVAAHEPVDDGALAFVAEAESRDDEGSSHGGWPHDPQKRASARSVAPHVLHFASADGEGALTAATTASGAAREAATRDIASSDLP